MLQKVRLSGIVDYSPFGMVTPGRSYSAGSGYRFGFNGQEQVDEVYGNGNLNTAQYWEYDLRTGRRWNIDPVIKFQESPYLVFGANPILFVDALGADSTVYFYRQNYGSEIAAKKEVKAIMNESEQIFRENGVTGLTFKMISEDEAKKMVENNELDPTDALLAVFPYGWPGFSPGSTYPSLNSDGSSVDLFNNDDRGSSVEYLGNYITLAPLKQLHLKYGKNITETEFIAQAASHEILHQYLLKASLMFTGGTASSNLPNQDATYHSTIAAPNLNTEGTYIWKTSNFTKDIDGRYAAERMLVMHKNAINIYLKGSQRGLSESGSDYNSQLSKDLINQWRQNVLTEHSQSGIYVH